MKIKKRILSILLSLSLVAGMFFALPANAAAATQKNTEKAMSFLETTVGSLLDPNTIFTNWTVTQLVKTVAGALGGVAGGMVSLTPAMVAPYLYEYYENNPLVPYAADEDWSNVPDSLDWGVTTGDMDSFFHAVKASLRAVGTLLAMILPDNGWTEGTPPDMSMGIPMPLYRFGLYNVMKTLELDGVVEIEGLNDIVVVLMNDFMELDEAFQTAYAEYLSAKEAGNQDKMDELKPVLDENGQKAKDLMDGFTSTILDPIFSLIKDFFADPLGVVMEKLPLLDKSLRAGDLDWIVTMLMPDATGSATLVDLVNGILAGVMVGEKPIGVVLTPKDFTTMIDLGKTEKFEAIVIYLVEVIQNVTDGVKNDSNMVAIKELVASIAGEENALVNSALNAMYNAKTASAGADTLINTLAMLAPAPTTTTDPDATTTTEVTTTSNASTTKAGDTTTTKASSTTTTAASTEEQTTGAGGNGGNSESPKTGDIALGVFAMLSISAAAVVVLRKKKD